MTTRITHPMTRMNFLALALVAVLGTGCSKGSDSSGEPSTAPAPTSPSAVISLSPNPATVAPGGTLTLTPSAGTPPYSFTLVSSTGSLSQPSGLFTIYTAPNTAGSAQLMISDSAGHTSYFTISIVGTNPGSGLLNVSPLAGTVVPSGALTFTVTGGTAPYIYQVLTANAGSFTGNVYYAPTTPMTVNIQISDSAGRTTTTTINVQNSTTPPTGAPNCAGNYNATVGGAVGYLQIIQSAQGQIGGTLTINGSSAVISGSCFLNGTTNVISFTNMYSGSVYVGTFFTNASNANQIFMSGSYNTTAGRIYSWWATSY